MKNIITLFFYRLALLILTPLLWLALLIRSKKQPAYRQRLAERFGFFGQDLLKHSMVIHGASVGEVLALKPLVEQLLFDHPELVITFTTFTPTGSEQVLKSFGDRVQHCYLPLDICFATWLFLHKLQPKTIVFMETEIWPDLVAQAKKRDIKLFIINGRISAKSIDNYGRLHWLIAPCLNRFNKIICQSQQHQENFIALGAAPERCIVAGNIKYDMTVSTAVLNKQAELQTLLPNNRKIWVVASTHQGDENIALKAFAQIIKQYPDLLLVLVPRHPERFSQVGKLAEQYGFNTVTRSSKMVIDSAQQVWLLDTLGELMALYGLADLVTIGGSFSDIQGHNPLEPAWFCKPIIVGPKMKNFADIIEQMLLNKAVIQLPETPEPEVLLAEQIVDLLTEPHAANKLGEQAKQVVLNNQGAMQRILAAISEHF